MALREVKMMIPKPKIEEIRLRLDQHATAAILENAGYKMHKGYKFRLREDEKTPSASVRGDGLIKDFGGDFTGDIIDLLREYHDMSFVEAVNYVAICVGVEI